MKTNTVTVPVTSVVSLMKPLPSLYDEASLRRQQEERVMQFLYEQDVSVSARDVAKDYHNIPGIKLDYYAAPRNVCRQRSAILRRLESQGKIVSTIFVGKRYYSTLVGRDD